MGEPRGPVEKELVGLLGKGHLLDDEAGGFRVGGEARENLDVARLQGFGSGWGSVTWGGRKCLVKVVEARWRLRKGAGRGGVGTGTPYNKCPTLERFESKARAPCRRIL